MLGQYLGQLAQSMGATESEPGTDGLVEPVTAEWVVGSLSVGIDEENRVIFVTAEELDLEDLEEEVGDEDEDEDDPVLLEDDGFDDPEVASAQFVLRPGQAVAFAEIAMDLVRAGRQPCVLCGRPMGPGGHSCPRWN